MTFTVHPFPVIHFVVVMADSEPGTNIVHIPTPFRFSTEYNQSASYKSQLETSSTVDRTDTILQKTS